MGDNQNNDGLRELNARVRGLWLRIDKTPQATPEIRRQAAHIAQPLVQLQGQLDRPRNAAHAEHLRRQLLDVQAALHALFEQQLNSRMGAGTAGVTSDEQPRS